MDTFAERFRHLRQLTGLKQADFASKIKLSQGRLSDIEKGKNKPSADTLVSVVEQFSTDVQWLLMGSGVAPLSVANTETKHEKLETGIIKGMEADEDFELFSKLKLLNKDNRKHVEKFMHFLIHEQQASSPSQASSIDHNAYME